MSSVREATISALEGVSLTRHVGRPTLKSVKLTRREIGKIYAATKTTHPDFPLGTRFGFAAAIITPKQFINAFNKVCEVDDELEDDWEFDIPPQPEATDPELENAADEAEERRMSAKWKQVIAHWDKFDAHEHVFKQKLEEVYDPQYFDGLRDDLLGFTHVCVSEMLDHLKDQCLQLTDVEKEARLEEARRPWDQNEQVARRF